MVCFGVTGGLSCTFSVHASNRLEKIMCNHQAHMYAQSNKTNSWTASLHFRHISFSLSYYHVLNEDTLTCKLRSGLFFTNPLPYLASLAELYKLPSPYIPISLIILRFWMITVFLILILHAQLSFDLFLLLMFVSLTAMLALFMVEYYFFRRK